MIRHVAMGVEFTSTIEVALLHIIKSLNPLKSTFDKDCIQISFTSVYYSTFWCNIISHLSAKFLREYCQLSLSHFCQVCMVCQALQVNCPSRWSLYLSIGSLCWSSQHQQQDRYSNVLQVLHFYDVISWWWWDWHWSLTAEMIPSWCCTPLLLSVEVVTNRGRWLLASGVPALNWTNRRQAPDLQHWERDRGGERNTYNLVLLLELLQLHMYAHLFKGSDFHHLKLLVTHNAQFVRGERNIRWTATFGDSSLARPNHHEGMI